MKKIYINERQILTESYYPEAGTDFPRFYDEKTDTWYEAQWNTEYAYPFGFWSDDCYGENEVFSVGDAWTTHENACGKVAERYFADIVYEQVGEDVSAIADKVNEIKSDITEYGYVYDDDSDTYVTEDGDEIDLWNESDNLCGYLRFLNDDYDRVHDILYDAIMNNHEINESELSQEIMDNVIENQDFTCRDGIDRALEMIGDSFDAFFEKGHSEGRIWPDIGMIGFYVTEQPDPESLLYIIDLLSKEDEIGLSYETMLHFHMVFEDWRTSDGRITCCTISDYVDGNYGENEDEDEEDDNEEVQYARQGKTVFVPHLANQKDKREFFKDFRNIRDRAIYVPREKAAGNLARYHAMRYPFGESKKGKSKKVYINESFINRIIKGMA